MNRRPSKVVIALARWALMAGLAGVIMTTLALVDLLRSPGNTDSRNTLLLVAAVLLSIAFVLAPIVRRAFARPTDFTLSGRRSRRTLLDEMREQGSSEVDANDHASTATTQDDTSATLIVRLLILAYGVFALVLIGVLWALK